MSLEQVMIDLTAALEDHGAIMEANTMALLATETPEASAIASGNVPAASPAAAAPNVPAAASPAATVATAPTAAPTTAGTVTADISMVEFEGLDKSGTPWSTDIHSSNGKKIGRTKLYQRKRGITEEDFQAGLQALMASLTTEPAAVVGAAPTAVAPVATVAPTPTAAPVAAAPTPQAAAPVAATVPTFPVIANPLAPTAIECEQAMVYYTHVNGLPAAQAAMKAWGMITMQDLPDNLYPDWVAYMQANVQP